MKKLTEAQERLLLAVPTNVTITDPNGKERTLLGTLHANHWPKGARVDTMTKLWELGLVKHSYLNFYACPVTLTEKGEKLVEKLKKIKAVLEEDT
jgi:hypothetical protein